MASVSKTLLINETLSAGKTGQSISIPQAAKNFIGLLKMTNKSGSVNLGGSIEHSPDGVYWKAVKTFSGISADGIEEQQITTNVWPYVRATVTVAGGGNALVEVSIWYDLSR